MATLTRNGSSILISFFFAEHHVWKVYRALIQHKVHYHDNMASTWEYWYREQQKPKTRELPQPKPVAEQSAEQLGQPTSAKATASHLIKSALQKSVSKNTTTANTTPPVVIYAQPQT